jgi:hypothetical protein
MVVVVNVVKSTDGRSEAMEIWITTLKHRRHEQLYMLDYCLRDPNKILCSHGMIAK